MAHRRRDLPPHHLVPKSRGGKSDPHNLRRIPRRLHQAWHRIFQNMTPEEVITHVVQYWTPPGYFEEVTLRNGRLYRVCPRPHQEDLRQGGHHPGAGGHLPSLPDPE